MWFCWLLSDHVEPPPSAETWKPKERLQMTLIHGAGVHRPVSRVVTYSRPSSAKPPRPLENSSVRRGEATDDGGSSADRRGNGPGGLGSVTRLTCSERVPRLPTSTARAAVMSRLRTSTETKSERRMKTAPCAPSRGGCGRDRLARTCASSPTCKSWA